MPLNLFKRKDKKEVELPIPSPPALGPAAFRQEPPPSLPSELEQFRMEPPRRAYPAPPEPTFTPTPAPSSDKMDLILSKLETIDARLRVIEEKIERKQSTPSPIF